MDKIENKIGRYNSEKINKNNNDIDQITTIDLLKRINDNDYDIPYLIAKHIDEIAKVVEAMVKTIKSDGRVIYLGSGTSGSLAQLDAMEIPPTFGVTNKILAIHTQFGLYRDINEIIGKIVPYRDIEEDCDNQFEKDLIAINFCSRDLLIGVSASGRTPYVVKALEYGKRLGGHVACLCMNKICTMAKIVDYPICIETNGEVIAGSTRMKAGTIQKMVLNMLSTAAMVKLNNVYRNLMVGIDVQHNSKLFDRATRIVMEICSINDYKVASNLLNACEKNVKLSCLCYLNKLSLIKAKKLLNSNDDNLHQALLAGATRHD